MNKNSSKPLKERMRESLIVCHQNGRLLDCFVLNYIECLDIFLNIPKMRKYPFEMREEFRSKCLINIVLKWKNINPEKNVLSCVKLMIARWFMNEIRNSQRDHYERYKVSLDNINLEHESL